MEWGYGIKDVSRKEDFKGSEKFGRAYCSEGAWRAVTVGFIAVYKKKGKLVWGRGEMGSEGK